MDDPLLSSLCTICHIDPPKYTCPRCYVQTCSLTCSKRHKIWASCNGVRDPTVFKPMSQLATPAGIDHDYNFLHSIEHRMERSEKRLVEDLEIITKAELERARTGEDEEIWKRRNRVVEPPGEICIARVLKFMGTNVITAPKGMRRNKENTTHWNRKHKAINWQVEWIREPPLERTLYRALGTKAIGEVYDALCEEERRMNMTEEEKRAEKKRKADGLKARTAKKARLEHQLRNLTTIPILQDEETGAWNFTPMYVPIPEVSLEEGPEPEPAPKKRNHNFYLHRPLTPSSMPKVLVPLDPTKSLTDILPKREVLEFPSIHVLEKGPDDLPKQFMLEKDYLAAVEKGDKNGSNSDSDTDMNNSSEETNSSSSDEDSDDETEEGEIG